MSQAPDLKTLFDVESAVEQGWKLLLAAQDPPMPIGFTSREVEGLKEERIDIQCVIGAHTGHRHPDRDGNQWLDAWNAQFTLQLCTSRLCKDPTGDDAKAAAPASRDDTHNDARARLRILAQYASQSLSEAYFPYHTITKIQESGSTPTIQDDDIDVSEITFDCMVSIRANAWPATTPP